MAFSLTRWLYSLCWTETSRPGILFERCTGWLLSHKVLLPGYSLLEQRIDLPEMILEIDARTHFTSAFTHSSEQSSRVSDLNISICAMLMAEACNTGPEPFIRNDVASLKRDRLTWTDSNYIRDETIRTANAILVAAQSGVPLANLWGVRWRQPMVCDLLFLERSGTVWSFWPSFWNNIRTNYHTR